MFVDVPFGFYLLIDLLGRLVTFAFLENKAKEGSNNKLDKVTISNMSAPLTKILKDFFKCHLTHS